MLNIQQAGKDVIITIKGDFNLIVINKNSKNINIKPKYPKVLNGYKKNKEGFINYKELKWRTISLISVLIYKSYKNNELSENEFDIIDTDLLNYVKNNL